MSESPIDLIGGEENIYYYSIAAGAIGFITELVSNSSFWPTCMEYQLQISSMSRTATTASTQPSTSLMHLPTWLRLF